MIARRPLLLAASGCVAATALGFLAGQGGTVAFAAALALASALAAATALQLLPVQRQQPAPPAREDQMPLRLRQIVEVLRESEQSEFGVERALRPVLVPIVAARLGRRGIDMVLAPRRAQALLGDVLWEIVRPDRPPAAYRVGRGLERDDLQTAIERLEQL